MRVIPGHADRGGVETLKDPVIAIGNFDGVHRGHQALLAEAARRAVEWDGEAGVLTFDPHPARFFAPSLAPPMLTTAARRLELLAAHGARFAVVERFDAAFAALEAGAFVETILAGALRVRHVVVGFDFSFGRGRRGTAESLAAAGPAAGFGVTVLPPVHQDGVVCSSTKIREFLLEGRVDGARLLLGRPYDVTGRVVRGSARGRTLGFPTANLKSDAEIVPRAGIYAGWARLLEGDGARRWPAAVSVGTNPTFTPEGGLAIEAHLLDFTGDLYDAALRLEFVARLRDERRFASADELVAAMREDVARTREILSRE